MAEPLVQVQVKAWGRDRRRAWVVSSTTVEFKKGSARPSGVLEPVCPWDPPAFQDLVGLRLRAAGGRCQ